MSIPGIHSTQPVNLTSPTIGGNKIEDSEISVQLLTRIAQAREQYGAENVRAVLEKVPNKSFKVRILRKVENPETE